MLKAFALQRNKIQTLYSRALSPALQESTTVDRDSRIYLAGGLSPQASRATSTQANIERLWNDQQALNLRYTLKV
jgi:hypothetical protein